MSATLGFQYVKRNQILLTIEGGDGAGKSTLIAKIEELFRTNARSFLKTREPGGTPAAEEVRSILLKNRNTQKPSALTELLLLEAARADHVEHVILPAFEQQKIVLCDRFTDSTIAYQGFGRGIDLATIEFLNRIACQGVVPTLTIWLKLDPMASLKRIEQRSAKEPNAAKDRMELESTEFHQRVFDGYAEIAKANPERVIEIDAGKTPEQIFEDVCAHSLWKKYFSELRPKA